MLMFIFVLIGVAYAFQELLLLPATLSKKDRSSPNNVLSADARERRAG